MKEKYEYGKHGKKEKNEGNFIDSQRKEHDKIQRSNERNDDSHVGKVTKMERLYKGKIITITNCKGGIKTAVTKKKKERKNTLELYE